FGTEPGPAQLCIKSLISPREFRFRWGPDRRRWGPHYDVHFCSVIKMSLEFGRGPISVLNHACSSGLQIGLRRNETIALSAAHRAVAGAVKLTCSPRFATALLGVPL